VFVTTGLDPVVHSGSSLAWIAGSSPAMTCGKFGGQADTCHSVKPAMTIISSIFSPLSAGDIPIINEETQG
jgi:hypothetical protein